MLMRSLVQGAAMLCLATQVWAVSASDEAQRDLDRMQGAWRATKVVRDGQELPESELGRYTRSVSGTDLVVVVEGPEGVATLQYKLSVDPSRSPKHFDALRTNGPTKGQTALGIYDWDGELLVTCIAPPGRERPTALESKAESGHSFIIWKRVSEKAATPKANPLDPKAVVLLEQVGELFQEVRSIRVEGTIRMTGSGSDGGRLVKVLFAMEPPNRFRFESRPEQGGAAFEVVSDGQKLVVHRLDRKEYTARPAPETLIEIGELMRDVGVPNAGILFRNLLTGDPTEALKFGVESAAYAGIERINSRPAHYLKFKQNNFNWDLWVATEGQAVVPRMRSVFTDGDERTTCVENYSGWELDAKHPEGTFEFKPAADAKEVQSLPME